MKKLAALLIACLFVSIVYIPPVQAETEDYSIISLDLTDESYRDLPVEGFQAIYYTITHLVYCESPVKIAESDDPKYVDCYDLDGDGTGDVGFTEGGESMDKLETCSVTGTLKLELDEVSGDGIMDPENYVWELTLIFTREITADCVGDIAEQTYTGSALTPTPVVTVNEKTLVKDTDYTLTYKQNTNAGTASVTIQGIGNYTGSVKKTFKIGPKTVTPTITLLETAYTYDGAAHKPEVTVKDGTKTLALGKEYTLTAEEGKDVGTYKVEVVLKGNYKGSAEATYTIDPCSLEDAEVTLSKTKVTYNGKYRRPSTTVILGKTVLEKGTEYTVAYENNKNAGKATVIITGTGNYIGEVRTTFTIAKKAQPMRAKAKTVSVKYAKVKKAKQTIKIAKAVTIKKAKGTLTYKKLSGSKYLSINKKTGKITVKKGTPKKTHKIKIKITAAGTNNYKKGSKTVTVKVKVK